MKENYKISFLTQIFDKISVEPKKTYSLNEEDNWFPLGEVEEKSIIQISGTTLGVLAKYGYPYHRRWVHISL